MKRACIPFISKDIVCEQADAEKLAKSLREILEDIGDANKAYEEWKKDPSVARSWEDVENELEKPNYPTV